MNNWLSKLLNASDEVSSKRVVALIGSVVIFATMVANSFSPQDVAPSDGLVNAALVLTLGCFGFTSLDKFAKK